MFKSMVFLFVEFVLGNSVQGVYTYSITHLQLNIMCLHAVPALVHLYLELKPTPLSF